MSRPTSPISNPIVIIFGMTPSLIAPTSTRSSSSPGSGMMSLLMSRNSPSSIATTGSKPGKSDWTEDEAADKAREKRLRDRLKKWEKGDAALQDELPALAPGSGEGNENAGPRPEIVVIGGPGGMSGLSPLVGPGMMRRASGSLGGQPEPEGNSSFFRTSILVPNLRSLAQERSCRVARRREINELTMRMGVGAVGGVLDQRDDVEEAFGSPILDGEPSVNESIPATTNEEKMWEDWSKRIEVWSNVRKIADRAVGSVVATSTSSKPEKSTLQPTQIPWSAVHHAWVAHRTSRDLRKAWMKESAGKFLREQDEDERDEDDESVEDNVDEVVERVKQDPDLDQHEQRLLPCIIDSGIITCCSTPHPY